MKKTLTLFACVRIRCLDFFAAFKIIAGFVLVSYNCIYYELVRSNI